MCTISGTCGCKSVATGTTLGAMLAVAAWWLLRRLWALLELLLAALILLLRWAVPAAWRVTVRVTRAGHRRWVARRTAPATPPPAAIEPPLMTLTDLLDKREANVR